MAIAEITELVMDPLDKERLLGRAIDTPKSSFSIDTYAFEVAGWALGKNSPVSTIEFACGDRIIGQFPLNVRRRDIATQHPTVNWAEETGFRASLSLVGLPAVFAIRMRAMLRDKTHLHLGTIKGTRQRMVTPAEPSIQPLILTTLGRTGSTWVTRLLGQHPQIVAYRPFQFEPRISTYWLSVLTALSEPSSYSQGLAADLSEKYWWIGSANALAPRPPDANISQFMGKDSVEALVSFCLSRIDGFYRQAAVAQEQPGATYFLEKFLPSPTMPTLLHELYPRAREIFLVRDFRDMVCSIFAYNAKRGVIRFGRQHAENDEQYVRQLRGSAKALLQGWQERSSRGYLLRYEDIILRPLEALPPLLKALNLDDSPETVSGMLTRAAAMTPDAQREHQTSSNPGASVGRWRHDLPLGLRKVCAESLGDALAAFGYQPDTELKSAEPSIA
jgi:hypothetical protein